MLKLPDGTIKALVEGKKRGKITSFIKGSEYLTVEIEIFNEENTVSSEMEALKRKIKSSFASYCKLSKDISPEILTTIKEISVPSILADTVVVHVNLKNDDKQELLATIEPASRMEKLLAILESEIEILKIENKIHNRVKKQMEKTQKEYYLNEQMRAIQKELGGKDDFKQELHELEEKITRENFPKKLKKKPFLKSRNWG